MDEHGFIRAVHRLLPADPRFRVWKINTAYTGGKPDCHYCGPKSDLWVEYKYLKRLPVRDNTGVAIDLSELQKDELQFLADSGRPVWVVVGSPKTAVVLSVYEALAGINTGEYKTRCLPYSRVAELIAEKCGAKHAQPDRVPRAQAKRKINCG